MRARRQVATVAATELKLLPEERLVLVQWRDAASTTSWTEQRQVELTLCHQVGWLTAETDETVTLAAGHADTGSWGSHTVIPRCQIDGIYDLFNRGK